MLIGSSSDQTLIRSAFHALAVGAALCAFRAGAVLLCAMRTISLFAAFFAAACKCEGAGQ
jgi:hypothetical protein